MVPLFPFLDHPGPKPPGNPAAMINAAAKLRTQAAAAGRLGAHVSTPGWRGNSATLFASRLELQQTTADLAAADLNRAARLLEDGAEDVKAAQKRWQDDMTEYREKLEERTP